MDLALGVASEAGSSVTMQMSVRDPSNKLSKQFGVPEGLWHAIEKIELILFASSASSCRGVRLRRELSDSELHDWQIDASRSALSDEWGHFVDKGWERDEGRRLVLGDAKGTYAPI
jgi:hypothetical protein